jgi:hypothetical protein
MLNPVISQYIANDRTDEARRHAARARRARRAAIAARDVPAARERIAAGAPSRWRAWGWNLSPRAFGSVRLLPR